MKYRDPKPDILRIEELVKSVKYGEIKLPKFQRPFVWKDKDVRKLFDSIYKGYPIGSILLWLSSLPLASERSLGDLDIEVKEDFPTNYLLDGQQRLSSLCGALYWNGKNKNSLWNISFDLEKEEFIHPKDTFKLSYFPLNKLINTSDFINQCKVFDIHEKKNIYYDRAEKLLKSIKDYKIPAVRIGDMSINEVAPIFERINSTGRKLTIVDLMRAATWKGGFDLNDAIKDIKEISEFSGFFNIPDSHILRNISAYFDLGVHKEDIDKLRDRKSEDLQIASNEIINSYKRAIEFFNTNLSITSNAYIPYSMQLTLVVEFFRLNPTPNLEQLKSLTKWFWQTSFSRHFEGGGVGQISKDLKNIRYLAEGSIESIPITKTIDFSTIFQSKLILNKAISKAFVLLLSINKPRSLFDGQSFNNDEELRFSNREVLHSIIPKSFKLDSSINFETPINYSLITSVHNSLLSDTPPLIYLNRLKDKYPEDFIKILESNFIDEQAYNCIKNLDFNGFLNRRSEIITNKIKLLIK
jgi:hypothetical protein